MLNELKKKKIRLDNNNNNNNQSKRYFIYSLLVFLSLIAAFYCLQIKLSTLNHHHHYCQLRLYLVRKKKQNGQINNTDYKRFQLNCQPYQKLFCYGLDPACSRSVDHQITGISNPTINLNLFQVPYSISSLVN